MAFTCQMKVVKVENGIVLCSDNEGRKYEVNPGLVYATAGDIIVVKCDEDKYVAVCNSNQQKKEPENVPG